MKKVFWTLLVAALPLVSCDNKTTAPATETAEVETQTITGGDIAFVRVDYVLAQSQIYQTEGVALKDKTEKDPLEVFTQAMENIMPSLEVKARRVGGATYQVPMEVRPDRQVSLSIRWLITYARSRGEKGMSNKLAAELLDAFNSRGGAVKKKEDTHRMAEANKAFAHYRW